MHPSGIRERGGNIVALPFRRFPIEAKGLHGARRPDMVLPMAFQPFIYRQKPRQAGDVLSLIHISTPRSPCPSCP